MMKGNGTIFRINAIIRSSAIQRAKVN